MPEFIYAFAVLIITRVLEAGKYGFAPIRGWCPQTRMMKLGVQVAKGCHSNALNASVRCEQKRLQRLSETVPANNRVTQVVRQGIPDRRTSHFHVVKTEWWYVESFWDSTGTLQTTDIILVAYSQPSIIDRRLAKNTAEGYRKAMDIKAGHLYQYTRKSNFCDMPPCFWDISDDVIWVLRGQESIWRRQWINQATPPSTVF